MLNIKIKLLILFYVIMKISKNLISSFKNGNKSF